MHHLDPKNVQMSGVLWKEIRMSGGLWMSKKTGQYFPVDLNTLRRLFTFRSGEERSKEV